MTYMPDSPMKSGWITTFNVQHIDTGEKWEKFNVRIAV